MSTVIFDFISHALQETLEFVKHLSHYVDGVTDTPPTPSLKKGVLVDIRLTREIEKWYEYINKEVHHLIKQCHTNADSKELLTFHL